MNLDHLEANRLVQKLVWSLGDLDHDCGKVEVAVIPPFTDLRMMQAIVDSEGLRIRYGAQDISTHDNGAYTGETSMDMLVRFGYAYAVVGRSECREYHGESNELVGVKAKKALKAGLTLIVCYGKALEVRKEGRQVEYVVGQIDAVFVHLSGKDATSLVITYEPIWTIGTGEVAASEDVQEVYGAIRWRIAELYDGSVADAVRVQHGGPVKSSNVVEITAQPDVDGAPVSGVSLKADRLVKIVTYYK